MIRLIKKISFEVTIITITVLLLIGTLGFTAYLSVVETKVHYDEVTIISCQKCIYNDNSGWLIEAKKQDGTIQKFIRNEPLLPTGNSKLLIAHMYSFFRPHNEITRTEFIAENEKIVRIP